MNRRRFLQVTGLPLTLGTAGCTSLISSSTAKDSDGDGISDTSDYAPRDPDVQVKSDLKETARPTTSSQRSTRPPTTATPTKSTPTSTPTPTTTTRPPPTTTPEPTPTNSIHANYEPIEDKAVVYFKSYSLQESRLALNRAGFDKDELDDRMKFTLVAQEYPNGSVLGLQTTEPKHIQSSHNEFTLNYDLTVDTSKPFSLQAFAIPANKSFQDAANDGSGVHLCETDRLVVNNGRLQKSPHPDALETLTKSSYKRINGEGLYTIQVSDAVDFGLTVYKHAYINANQKTTQKARKVVFNSYQSGLSSSLASIIYSAAEEAGHSSTREKVNYSIEAVQELPYVKDTVDNSYDNYNKYPIETLVEGGGDCEDTVILLAAALLSKPFNLGLVFIKLPPDNPTHIALGIKGSKDVVGSYYTYKDERYYYVETTGEGWQVGEMPDQYKNSSASITPLF